MDILYLATFFVAFISCLLSGFAHGGGGFITGPYWLNAGMTLAQGEAIGSFMSIGLSASSTLAFRKSSHMPQDKQMIVIFAIVTVVASIVGAFILPKIDTSLFKVVLAIITLASIPLLFKKPVKFSGLPQSRRLGMILGGVVLFIGSIVVTSAFSILFTVALTSLLGLSVLQATALRRQLGIGQSVVMFTGLTLQGSLLWQHAAMALIGGVIGSYIGTKYAIKKGELFAKWSLAIASVIGAIALLF